MRVSEVQREDPPNVQVWPGDRASSIRVPVVRHDPSFLRIQKFISVATRVDPPGPMLVLSQCNHVATAKLQTQAMLALQTDGAVAGDRDIGGANVGTVARSDKHRRGNAGSRSLERFDKVPNGARWAPSGQSCGA